MNVRESQESTPFDDLIYRTEEIESIIKVIEGEYADEEDDSYVFAINGEYGSGKTKFLELFEEEIKKNQSDRVLKINAWRDSFANDPLLSICYGFYEYFENLKKKSSSKKWDKTISTINKCGKFAVFAGNATLAGAPNAGFDAIAEGSDTKIFENFRSLRSSLADVKESLEKYVKQKNKKPTYILVDELDRCSPKYAVKFLETIHHFFCVEGLVFIIAIDQSQLRSYVEKIYGVNNDRFDGWYAKFIKASYNLQSMWDKCHDSILTPQYIEEKLQELFPDLETNNKNTFIDYHETIGSILKSFSFTLRQVNFFIKSLKRWYLHNKSDNYHRNNADLEVAAFLIALKLKNSIDYNNLIKNIENKSSDSIEIKNGILNKYEEVFKGKNQKWIAFSFTSYSEVKKLATDQYKSGTGYCSQEYDELYKIEDGEVYCKKDGHEITQCAALTIHEEIEKMKDFG